jgi:hypothetical protein
VQIHTVGIGEQYQLQVESVVTPNDRHCHSELDYLNRANQMDRNLIGE